MPRVHDEKPPRVPPPPFIKALVTHISRQRWLYLCAWLIIIGAAILQVPHLEVSNSINDFSNKNHPLYKRVNELQSEIPYTQTSIAFIKSDNVYSIEFINRLKSIEHDLENDTYINAYVIHAYEQYASLHRALPDRCYHVNEGTEAESSQELLKQFIATQNQTQEEQYNQFVKDEDIIKWYKHRGLIGESNSYYPIYISFLFDPESTSVEDQIKTNAIRDHIRNHLHQDEKAFFIGELFYQEANEKEITRTTLFNLPIMASVFFIILFVVFTSFRYLTTIIITCISNVIITVAWVSIFAKFSFIIPITLVAAFVIPLINSVYIYMDYVKYRNHGRSSTYALIKSLGLKWKSTLFANLTTTIGVSTIAFMPNQAGQDMALASIVAIIFGWIISITLMPLIMLFLYNEHTWKKNPTKDTTTSRLPWLSWSLKWRVLFLSAILIPLLSLDILGTGLSYKNQEIELLDNDVPIVQNINRADDIIGGIGRFNVYVDFSQEISPKERQLRALADFESSIEGIVGVEEILSAFSIASQAYSYIDTSDDHPLFEDKERIARIIKTFRPEVMENLVNQSENIYVIQVRYQISLYGDGDTIIHQIRKAFRDTMQQKIDHARITLISNKITKEAHMASTVEFLQESFIYSALLLGLLISIILRSVILGITAVILNGLAVTSVFGLVYLFNWQLDVAIAILAQIVLGFSVDTVIHFATSVHQQEQRGMSFRAGISRGWNDVLIPVVISTGILVGGFSPFMFSNQIPLAHFGLLFAYTIIAAAVSNLFLFPTTWTTLRKWTQKTKKTPTIHTA